jgi:hypothetical protein
MVLRDEQRLRSMHKNWNNLCQRPPLRTDPSSPLYQSLLGLSQQYPLTCMARAGAGCRIGQMHDVSLMSAEALVEQ